MTRFGRCQAQPRPAALAKLLSPSLTNSTYQLNLPTDALIDLKVRRLLGRFIPVWGWLNGSPSSHSGGPRAGVMSGGFVSAQAS